MKHNFEKFCKDYQYIENYEKAKADDFIGWDCHHRLETHNSDGERRLVDITVAELQALDMYYNRPAEELIFLRKGEHTALRKVSDVSKKKMIEARKGKHLGKDNSFYGKHHSEETKKKISEAAEGNKHALGCKHSEEARKKLSEANKGMHWFNNGEINIRAKECPDGFVPGRIKKL